jgi:nitrite reductase/ring-hydroxylating ferredoxin subunit
MYTISASLRQAPVHVERPLQTAAAAVGRFPVYTPAVRQILTSHWHHARFDLESGCTFDLWADDTPTFPVEVRDGEV